MYYSEGQPLSVSECGFRFCSQSSFRTPHSTIRITMRVILPQKSDNFKGSFFCLMRLRARMTLPRKGVKINPAGKNPVAETTTNFS
jgi:hypothetical protein